MSGSTSLGFPYPTDGDLVQLVDESIQSLAEATETYLVGSEGVITAGANITLGTSKIYRRGPTGFFLVENLATTAAILGAAVIATLPAGYRPPVKWRGLVWNFTGSASVLVDINTNGTVQTAMNIASGHGLYGSVSFPVL